MRSDRTPHPWRPRNRRTSGRAALPVIGLCAFAVVAGSTPATAATQTLGSTARVSVANGGRQAAGYPATSVSLSASGRYVAFTSQAPDLVTSDTNGTGNDAFVLDRSTRKVQLVSVLQDGTQPGPVRAGFGDTSVVGPVQLSAGGRWVAFTVETAAPHPYRQMFLRDRLTSKASMVEWGRVAAISPDGRFVAGYDEDLYAHISSVRVYDARTRQRTFVYESQDAVDSITGVAVSADGRFVAYGLVHADRTLASRDGVYRWDRQTGVASLIAQDGQNPVMTPDGRYVAYQSMGSYGTADPNGVLDVFRKDMLTRKIIRVSLAGLRTPANGASYPQSISANGDRVAFTSAATNLVAADTNRHTDVFVRDIRSAVTSRVSVASDGSQSNAGSSAPGISADGNHVSFLSRSSNLVPNDSNGQVDAFAFDIVPFK